MKPKPRIAKGQDGWELHRPGYGFTTPVVLGPYPNHGAALAALTGGTATAGQVTQRTDTPSGRRPWSWPMEIR